MFNEELIFLTKIIFFIEKSYYRRTIIFSDGKHIFGGKRNNIIKEKIKISGGKSYFGSPTASGACPRATSRNFAQDTTSFIEKGRIRAELWPFERAV